MSEHLAARTVYLSGLRNEVTESVLERAFSKFGLIDCIEAPNFIVFRDSSSAAAVIHNANLNDAGFDIGGGQRVGVSRRNEPPIIYSGSKLERLLCNSNVILNNNNTNNTNNTTNNTTTTNNNINNNNNTNNNNNNNSNNNNTNNTGIGFGGSVNSSGNIGVGVGVAVGMGMGIGMGMGMGIGMAGAGVGPNSQFGKNFNYTAVFRERTKLDSKAHGSRQQHRNRIQSLVQRGKWGSDIDIVAELSVLTQNTYFVKIEHQRDNNPNVISLQETLRSALVVYGKHGLPVHVSVNYSLTASVTPTSTPQAENTAEFQHQINLNVELKPWDKASVIITQLGEAELGNTSQEVLGTQLPHDVFLSFLLCCSASGTDYSDQFDHLSSFNAKFS